MESYGYWTRLGRDRVSRRRLLRTAGIGGVGLAGAALVGCGTDEEEPDDTVAPVTPDPDDDDVAPDPGDPVEGGVLRIHGQDTIGFDPHGNFSFRTHLNQSFFMEGLLEVPIGPGSHPTDFTPVSNVGDTWEMEDEVTFVVQLRNDVHFHDRPPVNGRQLVAEDVSYSYQRMIDMLFTYRDIVEVIAETEVVDDLTLRFTLHEPFADFLGNLANHYNWLVARELDEEFGDMARPEAAIGAGPFMLESYEPNVVQTYVPNPNYFRGAPHVEKVEYLVLPDVATRDSMYRAGDLDIYNVTALSRPAIESAVPDTQWDEHFSNGGGIFYYGNAPGELAEDIRVRQAVNHMVDRDAFLAAFFHDQGTVYNGPPILAAYTDWQVPFEQLPAEAQELWEYDPAKGRRLLDAAGWDFDKTWDLDFSPDYGAFWADSAELIMDFMGEIGIQTRAVAKEYGEWLATGHAGIYDEFAWGPMTPQLSIDAWIWGLFHSQSGVNKAHAQDPRIDELVQRTRVIYDEEERKEAVAEASKYIASQAVYVYMPIGFVNGATSPRVRNFHHKRGYYVGKAARLAWIDE